MPEKHPRRMQPTQQAEPQRPRMQPEEYPDLRQWLTEHGLEDAVILGVFANTLLDDFTATERRFRHALLATRYEFMHITGDELEGSGGAE